MDVFFIDCQAGRPQQQADCVCGNAPLRRCALCPNAQPLPLRLNLNDERSLVLFFFLRNGVDILMKHSTSPFYIKDPARNRNYIEVHNIVLSDEQLCLPNPEENPPVAIAGDSKAFGPPQLPAPQTHWDTSSSERASAISAPWPTEEANPTPPRRKEV